MKRFISFFYGSMLIWDSIVFFILLIYFIVLLLLEKRFFCIVIFCVLLIELFYLVEFSFWNILFGYFKVLLSLHKIIHHTFYIHSFCLSRLVSLSFAFLNELLFDFFHKWIIMEVFLNIFLGFQFNLGQIWTISLLNEIFTYLIFCKFVFICYLDFDQLVIVFACSIFSL